MRKLCIIFLWVYGIVVGLGQESGVFKINDHRHLVLVGAGANVAGDGFECFTGIEGREARGSYAFLYRFGSSTPIQVPLKKDIAIAEYNYPDNDNPALDSVIISKGMFADSIAMEINTHVECWGSKGNDDQVRRKYVKIDYNTGLWTEFTERVNIRKEAVWVWVFKPFIGYLWYKFYTTRTWEQTMQGPYVTPVRNELTPVRDIISSNDNIHINSKYDFRPYRNNHRWYYSLPLNSKNANIPDTLWVPFPVGQGEPIMNKAVNDVLTRKTS